MNPKINFAAWEVKKEYDDVIKAIGRNRKRILHLFKKLISKGGKATFKTAVEIIQSVLYR
jgi:hypothetical protein